MTPTTALANLNTLTWDQLGSLYTILNGRALAATTNTGRTRAMNARERVANEASRRGCVARKSYSGSYMVGPASHFQAI